MHAIPYQITGKLIVATEEQRVRQAGGAGTPARANGLAVRLLGGSELEEVEPHVAGVAGLHVPESGLVDFRLVAAALERELELLGCSLALSCAVSGLEETSRGVRITTTRGTVEARVAVACAGLQSDRCSRRRPAPTGDGVTIVPFRGSYFALAPEVVSWCRGMIYPVPDPRLPFLGVHVNRRPDGGAWVGPNAVLALAREGYSRRQVALGDVREVAGSGAFWRLARRHWRAGAVEVTRDVVPHLVARAVRRLLPGIAREHLLPAPAGIRAQALHSDGTLADDFLFAETARSLHVQNAPSPAATSSLAIARVLAQRTLAKAEPERAGTSVSDG